MPVGAGVVGPGSSGKPGGGGTNPSGAQGAVYWTGSAWVTTGQAAVTGSPTITTPANIPGLSGSPDIAGVGGDPNVDEEFDQNTAGAPSGWTAFDAPDTLNTTDFPSHLHIAKISPGNANPNLAGVYRAAPALPFTVTCKLSDAYLKLSANRAGLFVANQAPAAAAGTIVDLGISQTVTPAAVIYSNVYTGYTGAGGGAATVPSLGAPQRPPLYLRMVVTSSSVLLVQISYNGQVWIDGTTYNPGFTATFLGLHCAPVVSSGKGEAMFDWIRF